MLVEFESSDRAPAGLTTDRPTHGRTWSSETMQVVLNALTTARVISAMSCVAAASRLRVGWV